MGILTDYLDTIVDNPELYKEIQHWESRWPEIALRRKHADIGSTAFARGYQMDAISVSDYTFQHFWKILKPEFGREILDRHTSDWNYFGGIDISSSTRPGSVIFTVGVRGDGLRFPVDLRVGKWSSPQFVNEVKQCYNEFRHQVFLVENNAVQTQFVEWLEHDARYINVQGYLTGKQKYDPNIGLPSLDLEFERDTWTFPMGIIQGHSQTDCRGGRDGGLCVWCRWINEMAMHPQYATSDTVMAMWFAREAIRLYWNAGFYYEDAPEEAGIFNFNRGEW